jgi:hypothetical protein
MTSRYRTNSEFETFRERVTAFAAGQGRVFRPGQLEAIGVDPSIVRTMVGRQWWIRMRHGVYADAEAWAASEGDPTDRHLLQCAAAIVSLPLETYAFGRTAAAVHGLPAPRNQLTALHLVRGIATDQRALLGRVTSTEGLPDVRIKTHDLSGDSVLTIGGVPTVSRDLAGISAAATYSPDWALSVLDGAAWKRPESIERLAAIADDWPRLRGIGVVRSMLPLVRSGAQTPLESISRLRLVKAGLPEPMLQYPLYDREGLVGYADMGWPELGVIGECDGLMKYQSGEVLIQEKRREDRIRALGFIVVRWTWDDIIRHSQEVAAQIWRASRLATRRAI